jgi:phosphohistidine phosphatase
MKKIILVRHATAVARAAGKDDFKRSLRKKGREEARAMAGWYKSAADRPDVIVSSPANRAIETARIFAKTLGYPAKKIVQKKKFYGVASLDVFLKMLAALDKKSNSVMLFGHDPEFSEFASYLVGGFEDGLPKCSVHSISLDRKDWQSLGPGEGRIEAYEHPAGVQERMKLLDELENKVSDEIAARVLGVLGDFGVTPGKKDEDRVRRASAKLAGRFKARLPIDRADADSGDAAEKAEAETVA